MYTLKLQRTTYFFQPTSTPMNPSNNTRAIPSSSPKRTLHVSSTSSARTDGVPMPPRATAFARADAPSLLHRTTASARANASPRATVSTQMNGVGQLCTPMTARTDAPPVLLRIPSVRTYVPPATPRALATARTGHPVQPTVTENSNGNE